MSDIFQCGDNAALVGYLYGECEPAERRAIAAHVEICGACAAELAALGSTRLQLASWTPPEAELGFQVVRAPAPDLTAQKAKDPMPDAGSLRPWAWFGQAAAACLIFAAGLWMGIERGDNGPETRSAETIASAPANVASTNDLAALERRLRAEMAQVRSVPASAAATETPSEARLLARVRTLIEESEQRQQRELAIRTAQVVRDFDTQRRVDLAEIQRTVGQIEGQTGAEVRDQREMLNYLMRVSQQQGR